jgi:hypothetical protein
MAFPNLPSPLRRAACACALAAVAGAALAPAAHAATTLSTEQRSVPVAAWAGTVAWSSYDPATNDYHLVVSRNGATPQRLAVAPSPNAFDVSLGTNRNGSTYAVYSRCTTPATHSTPPTGCDLYRTSIASGAETKLETLSSPDWDERDPSIFRGTIAFVRRETHGGVTKDVLRTGTTVSGATVSTALVKQTLGGGSLSDTALSFSRIAYIRASRNGSTREVHVRTLHANGSDRLVYTARSGGANFANIAGLSVSDTGASFMWARTNQGSGAGNRLVRYSVNTRRLAFALGSSRWTSSAWASQALGAAVMVDQSGTGTCFGNVNDPPQATQCSVQLTGHVAFTAGP